MSRPIQKHITSLPDVLIYALHKRLRVKKKPKDMAAMRDAVKRVYGDFVAVPADLAHLVKTGSK